MSLGDWVQRKERKENEDLTLPICFTCLFGFLLGVARRVPEKACRSWGRDKVRRRKHGREDLCNPLEMGVSGEEAEEGVKI